MGSFSKGRPFILPTYSENFGIVIAEALASGVPVITTKNTPWEEDGGELHNCGWWIDNNIDALSAALKQAIGLSNESRHCMGQNGRKLVANKYSWGKIAEDMSSVYAWVLNGGSTPDCIILPLNDE